MNLDFTIKGKVIAKQSMKIGRYGIKYTPREVKDYASLVQKSFLAKYPMWTYRYYDDVGLRVYISVYKSIPKSYSKKKTKEASVNYIRPTSKPDCDNIAKSICDALNGLAYPDDRQIVSLTVNKYYTECEDSVRVVIESVIMDETEQKILGVGDYYGK
jgi:Holliday junction resolvase RusA-like endonuclease